MYGFVLMLHSWIRWIAIVAGVGATLAAFRSSRDAERPAEWWGLLFMTTLDIQLLLGLVLYLAVSPNMQMIREHFGEAMRISQLRFWAVEHITAMIVAVALAHVARVLARQAPTPAARRTRRLLCYGIAIVLVLAATPWPGLAYGRPLLRW
jgi:hypothetical protein